METAQPPSTAMSNGLRSERKYVQAKRRGAASTTKPAKKRSGVFTGIVLSATHLDATQRTRLEEVVRLMGGELSGTFDRSMHALIAGGVGSEKYFAAKRWGVPVVDAAWVEACFRAEDLVDVDNYETPIFHKLRFSVTGWNEKISVKNEIIDLISTNGGNYAASMRPEATTHLVAESFVGPKCEATLTYGNIDVVSDTWVRDCVAADAYLPVEDKYRVKSEVIEDRRAQQRKKMQALRNKRDREIAEEREQKEARQAALEALMASEREALDRSERADTQLTLLSHFSVFLHGFDPKRWRTVQAIISRTGATVLWEWNPTATHVVVGDRPNADYLDMLRRLQPDLEEITTTDIMASLQDGVVPPRKRRRLLICVSRYVGTERLRVETLAKELGARFTDRLTRQNPAVTLLISLDLTGPKCTKAREWGIPVYSLEWLEGEAKTKKAEDEAASNKATNDKATASANNQ
ncbi:DNA topoisomerase 2-binding protein 1 [Hondaea fermentalgiana]|uniref:DNA topoisomerase 2-binding protein 1 n=1 Tax=Hondaea fermentalgiana TaxID=2315210 RepID=A0A2R5GA28_9STRA|nr:DNA topoisomerase 2-binding protein 1 [Hondaea fermentalgiana]|eukprot:GBG25393.1 DNA topoisomerase 2-binding protein 1 [Hondaea fermentalgiana]